MRKSGKLLAIIMILIVSAVLSACTGGGPAATDAGEKAAVPVEVAKVSEGVVSESARLTGKLAPNKSVAVAPKISGKIASIDVVLGQQVAQGEALFSLDTSDLQTALKQAEASYQSAAANLTQTQSSTDQGLHQAENGLKQAQQAYDDQKKELDRTTELHQAGFVSDQQMEQAKTAFQNAEIALNNARKAFETAKKQTGLAVANASVQQARISVDKARQDLANTRVTAPMAGVVSYINGNAGEFASPQQPVVTMVDTSTLLVKVNVSEQEISTVQSGDAAEVIIPAAGKTLKLSVQSVSPVMDQQAKAYPVEIAVPNADGALKADMIAEVRFLGAAKEEAAVLVVPRSAVLEEQGKSYIFKAENGKAVKQEVVIGKQSSDLAEVVSGAAKGDQVVIRGMTLLNDGDEVAVQ